MHPAIRIAVLLVLAAALPSLSVEACATLFLLAVVASAGWGGRPFLLDSARALARLRWLFLAILVLYVGFTAGEPVAERFPGVSREGLLEGTRRALIVALLVVAVHGLLRPLSPATLAAALVWLLQPLAWIGLRLERFAIRLGMTLDEMARLPHLGGRGDVLTRVAACALAIEGRAGEAGGDLRLDRLTAPPAWQWLAPAVLGAALFGLPT